MSSGSRGTGIATSDGLYGGALKYRQPEKGFRSAVDSLALMCFSAALWERSPQRLLDLGCGAGFLMLSAAVFWPELRATGVEISAERHRFAVANIEENALGDRVNAVHADLRDWKPTDSSPYDLVIANPPFFSVGSGTLPPDPDKARARFEVTLTLSDLVMLAASNLSEEGIMTCIYPFERRDELFASASKNDLFLYREQSVLPKRGGAPRFVLSAWRKRKCSLEGDKKTSLEPMILQDETGLLGAELRRFEIGLSRLNS